MKVSALSVPALLAVLASSSPLGAVHQLNERQYTQCSDPPVNALIMAIPKIPGGLAFCSSLVGVRTSTTSITGTVTSRSTSTITGLTTTSITSGTSTSVTVTTSFVTSTSTPATVTTTFTTTNTLIPYRRRQVPQNPNPAALALAPQPGISAACSCLIGSNTVITSTVSTASTVFTTATTNRITTSTTILPSTTLSTTSTVVRSTTTTLTAATASVTAVNSYRKREEIVGRLCTYNVPSISSTAITQAGTPTYTNGRKKCAIYCDGIPNCISFTFYVQSGNSGTCTAYSTLYNGNKLSCGEIGTGTYFIAYDELS